MSTPPARETEETLIPLSVLFATVGVIILLTVTAIWILAPATLPRALYRAAATLAQAETGRLLPTPAALAVLPDWTPEISEDQESDPILLPETPADGEFDMAESIATENPQRRSLAGRPTRIIIPDIALDAPVDDIGLESVERDGESYFQWAVPKRYEVGWHNNSALLGKPGNTVLNGHHNAFGEVFRDLIDLKAGDAIMLYDGQQEYVYQVTDSELFPEKGQPLAVRLENARWIEPTDDERVTLVTCWPYTGNTHRLVVVARPASQAGRYISSETK